ncbi:speckle-type POZ protein [Trichonephila clavipes]|nr:speckle-type POZ protein [Trichonephila clavipes]
MPNIDEDRKFSFIWVLENFIFAVEKQGESICSPVFRGMNGSEWGLALFPRGYDNSAYIAFFLQKVSDGDSDDFPIEWELSLLRADGVPRKTTKMDARSFRPDQALGDQVFMKIDDLLARRNELMPNDKLTVCCRIYKADREPRLSGLSFARTRIGLERRSFVWVIDKFRTSNRKKVFRLDPSSEQIPTLVLSIHSTNDHFLLEISQGRARKRNLTVCEISIIDSNGKVLDTKRGDYMFEPNGTTAWQFPPLIPAAIWRANANVYVPNDVLSLRCECIISVGVTSNKLEDYRKFSFPSTSSPLSVSLIHDTDSLGFNKSDVKKGSCPPHCLAKDLQDLLQNGAMSDIKLITPTSEFTAHKNIICARSPVFKSILMNNRAVDHINIDNIEDDTLKRMLTYMYTDSAEDLDWQTALKLYKAADTYRIQRLEEFCSTVLKASLSPTNACIILNLADQQKDRDLKVEVQKFILKHGKEIFNSTIWTAYMKENPFLAMEAMYLNCIKTSETR